MQRLSDLSAEYGYDTKTVFRQLTNYNQHKKMFVLPAPEALIILFPKTNEKQHDKTRL